MYERFAPLSSRAKFTNTNVTVEVSIHGIVCLAFLMYSFVYNNKKIYECCLLLKYYPV